MGMRFLAFSFSFIIYLPRKAQLKSHLPSGNLCGPVLHCVIASKNVEVKSEFLKNGVCMALAELQSSCTQKKSVETNFYLWGTSHVGLPQGNSSSCKFRELNWKTEKFIREPRGF